MIADVATKLVEIYCVVDDFCKDFIPEMEKCLIAETPKKQYRKPQMTYSEMMTIVIYFHLSGYKDFKHFYHHCVMQQWKSYFPRLHSYPRFVARMPELMLPLATLLCTTLRGKNTGISFIDSTPLAVCDNHRIHSNKVFDGIAQRGKSSTGWFYGIKLHLVINELGDIINVVFTTGNVHDANPKVVTTLTKDIVGKLFGDKGYIGEKLAKLLEQNGIQLITKLRANMKKREMPEIDKILLRKRAVIESVNDILKNTCMIEHTRHRSPANFFVNLIAGLAAYAFLPHKPSINFTVKQRKKVNDILLVA